MLLTDPEQPLLNRFMSRDLQQPKTLLLLRSDPSAPVKHQSAMLYFRMRPKKDLQKLVSQR